MKKLTIVVVLLLGAVGKLYAQEDPEPTAYKLNASRDKLVKVYQEKDAARMLVYLSTGMPPITLKLKMIAWFLIILDM